MLNRFFLAHNYSKSVMKFIIIFLIFVVACSAQNSGNMNSTEGILTSVQGCSLDEIGNIVSCACFANALVDPNNENIQNCEDVTGSNPISLKSACEPYLIDNDQDYDFAGIITSIEYTKNQCFDSSVYSAVVRQQLKTSSRIAPIFGHGVVIVLKILLCTAPNLNNYVHPPPSDLPTNRVLEGTLRTKAALLRKNNNI